LEDSATLELAGTINSRLIEGVISFSLFFFAGGSVFSSYSLVVKQTKHLLAEVRISYL
jgi:hypothetical protein